ncbi:F-box associated ubiquitination effector family protein, partial [Striga hermonthica]
AVPEDKRVAFVATRFRGRAATWWMHITSMWHRQGKSPIISWMKFRKYVEDEFLPFNYDSVVYQHLHNLRQGTRSVDDYTNEFYHLLNRVEVHKTKSQLISRYVSGLRVAIQDMLNIVKPKSVSDAHQRARLVEQQLARRTSSTFPSSTRSGPATGGMQQPGRNLPSSGGGAGHPTAPGRFPLAGSGNQRQPGIGGPPPAAAGVRSGSGLWCFGCGEYGHRQSACPRGSTS